MSVFDILRMKKRSGPPLIAGVVVAVCVLIIIGALGWRWYAGGTVQTVSVSVTTVLAPDSVRALTHLRQGMPLRDVVPERTQSRLERHPWIAEATVGIQPFRNQVTVQIEERIPVGRWVGPDGRAEFYLDVYGHAMPTRADMSFDVPLVYDDSISYHPHESVVSSTLQQVLQAIRESETAYDIISGVHMDPDHTVHLYVTHPQGHTITVRLGERGYPEKLRRLEAFHTQVLQRTSDPIQTIDLRFRGQVVTQP